MLVSADLRLVDLPPALLVPYLGINADGFRLGYGGGYYDHTLERTPQPCALGIAYTYLATQFASAPHAAALDMIIIEVERRSQLTHQQ